MVDQAFSSLYDLAPPFPLSYQQVVYLSQSCCVSLVELLKGDGRGVGRSQIIQWRESLVLYQSFNTLGLVL